MITFKELSFSLKVAVVTSYSILVIYILAFLIGFIEGIIGVN